MAAACSVRDGFTAREGAMAKRAATAAKQISISEKTRRSARRFEGCVVIACFEFGLKDPVTTIPFLTGKTAGIVVHQPRFWQTKERKFDVKENLMSVILHSYREP
jgi:hypothetical protein